MIDGVLTESGNYDISNHSYNVAWSGIGQYNDLVNECYFIVADRNCREGSNLLKEAQNHLEKGGKIKLIEMPKIDITSSFVRDKLSKGEDVSEYLPKKVNDYIIKNGLYKNNPEE